MIETNLNKLNIEVWLELPTEGIKPPHKNCDQCMIPWSLEKLWINNRKILRFFYGSPYARVVFFTNRWSFEVVSPLCEQGLRKRGMGHRLPLLVLLPSTLVCDSIQSDEQPFDFPTFHAFWFLHVCSDSSLTLGLRHYITHYFLLYKTAFLSRHAYMLKLFLLYKSANVCMTCCSFIF